MFSKIICLSFIFSLIGIGFASAMDSATYRKTVLSLTDEGLYFSAVPFMKEYLVRNQSPLDQDLDSALDQIMSHTGVRPFEALPDRVLEQSRSSSIRYILAKKHFRNSRLNEALSELDKVNASHPIYPFAAHLKGTINSLIGKQDVAISHFRDCIEFSESRVGKEKQGVKIRQLLINKDYCAAGIARSEFARKNYDQADLLYLDIPKSSYIWPEILFEEAWNSYYKGNYNRTLGKLVSYKAPVFDFIFNPEIEVLRALAYYKMCLYDDASKTVDSFYQRLETDSKELKNYLVSRGRDYDYFYKVITTFETDSGNESTLLRTVLKSISKDAAYQELKQSLLDAIEEFKKVKGMKGNRLREVLMRNLSDVVETYKDLIGGYVRTQLVSRYGELSRSFQSMSYIKLEVLNLRKQKLYSNDLPEQAKKRGDVEYIQRNDKQYFWTFNGEFWADELGDYVFALRSEC